MIWDDDEDRPKPPDYFDILDAVGRGYSFVWHQRQYLAQLAIFPVIFVFITGIVSLYFNPGMDPIRGFLVHLPQSFFLAWYFFVTTRLALLGERIEKMPREAQFAAVRRHAMTLTILIYLLCNAAIAALTAFLMSGQTGTGTPTLIVQALSLPALIGFVWGMRYLTLYVPASIGYALKDFLEAVRGFGFSFRLIFLAILCVLPVIFSTLIVLSLLQSLLPAQNPAADAFSLDGFTALYLAVASVFTMIAFIAIHAGTVFAVGDIITRRMKERPQKK